MPVWETMIENDKEKKFRITIIAELTEFGVMHLHNALKKAIWETDSSIPYSSKIEKLVEDK